jgi:hypothetical protein
MGARYTSAPTKLTVKSGSSWVFNVYYIGNGIIPDDVLAGFITDNMPSTVGAWYDVAQFTGTYKTAAGVLAPLAQNGTTLYGTFGGTYTFTDTLAAWASGDQVAGVMMVVA